MNRISITRAFVVAVILIGITATAVFAGRSRTNLKSSDLSPGIGSFILSGNFTGVGNIDLKLTLTAHGEVVNLMCTNNGQQKPPPKNPVINATATAVFGVEDYTENGKLTWSVEASEDDLSAKELGCPNNNWTANTNELKVNWTAAKLIAEDINNSQNVVNIDGKPSIDLSCVAFNNYTEVSCTRN